MADDQNTQEVVPPVMAEPNPAPEQTVQDPYTLSWKITGVKTRNEVPYTSAVVQTYWVVTGTDSEGRSGSFTGATPFTTANLPSNQEFIPFENLTEEIVLGWIKAVVVGGYKEHIMGVISKQIQQQINPIVEAQLPWATSNVAVAPDSIVNSANASPSVEPLPPVSESTPDANTQPEQSV